MEVCGGFMCVGQDNTESFGEACYLTDFFHISPIIPQRQTPDCKALWQKNFSKTITWLILTLFLWSIQ